MLLLRETARSAHSRKFGNQRQRRRHAWNNDHVWGGVRVLEGWLANWEKTYMHLIKAKILRSLALTSIQQGYTTVFFKLMVPCIVIQC